MKDWSIYNTFGCDDYGFGLPYPYLWEKADRYTIKEIDGLQCRVYTNLYKSFLRYKHYELVKRGDYRHAHKIFIALVRGWEHCRYRDLNG